MTGRVLRMNNIGRHIFEFAVVAVTVVALAILLYGLGSLLF
jgi:hypothetical protein